MPSIRKVRPREFTGFLLNPHKGCQTFQRFNGDPLYPTQRWSESGPTQFPDREFEGVTPGYLPSTVAYCRWYWEVLEPEPGGYDFAMIERSLKTAASRGQTLHVRLMPHGPARGDNLPQWYRERFETVTRDTHNRGERCTCPIYDSMEYLDTWGGLITEFGRRFDGHPSLEAIDMSYIGPWGEGAGECSKEGVDRMVRVYLDAHPKTLICAMISGYQMTAGVRAGTGWRCDSCDDLGLWGDQNAPLATRWNHLYDSYPSSVTKAGAQDAWKNGPVAYEPGGAMMSGYERGFDLDFIMAQDLKYRGSLISFKSCRLPDEWMEPLLRFCNDLGYRFVLRQAEFDTTGARGGKVSFSSWIENVGVAPIYHTYDFAVKLTQGDRTHIRRIPVDIRKWLPGDSWVEDVIAVPKEFQPGSAMLHAGIIDKWTGEVKVRFAVEGADPDGWVPLDTVEITES